MTPYSPFRDVACQRCDCVFAVAGAVDPDTYVCDDCLDAQAQTAIEAEQARYYGGGGLWAARAREDEGRRVKR